MDPRLNVSLLGLPVCNVSASIAPTGAYYGVRSAVCVATSAGRDMLWIDVDVEDGYPE
eukprot:m.46896 g.46896  ORF g.46896 m.46896 type:complete len:58 (-) comp13182_c0_seq1:23-196(-)